MELIAKPPRWCSWWLNESTCVTCLTRVWHWWVQDECQPMHVGMTVNGAEKSHIQYLYTVYQFWLLPSDAANGSWSRCGNRVSERWSYFSRATQLVRGRPGFHLKSVSSRAVFFPAGHSKRIRIYFSLYFVTIQTATTAHKEVSQFRASLEQ